MALLSKPAENYYEQYPSDESWKAFVDMSLKISKTPVMLSNDWFWFRHGWDCSLVNEWNSRPSRVLEGE